MTLNLPVLLLKNLVLLPHEEVKLELNNDLSKRIVNLATRNHENQLFVVVPNNKFEEYPDIHDLPLVGIVAEVKSKIELPNGHYRVVLGGLKRVKVKFYSNYLLDNEVLEVACNELELPAFNVIEETALKRKLLELVEGFINVARFVSNSFLNTLRNAPDLDILCDLIVIHVPFSIDKKMLYMEEINPLHRANALIIDLNVELQVLEIDNRIEENLREEFENTQKEYILKEKLREIQKELGVTEDVKTDTINKFYELLDDLDVSESVYKKFISEIRRFEYTNDNSPEYSVHHNYLDLVLNLPWNKSGVDETDLNATRKSLNNSHFGLEQVKDRIVEYVMIRNRNKYYRAPILCLVGPPGVGKTTLGLSIAKALHKEFYKISVGGLNDSNELVGHRKTYLGASHGKIIEAIKRTGVNNPLILIDEVDKMAKDFRGDPASVLLDILDPEQNVNFIDNFVEEGFDLSKVFFILTANSVDTIPPALYDRLEIIELSSYTEFEKVDIAKNYLLPDIFSDFLIKSKVNLDDDVLIKIIRFYTREAGVRDLRRVLESLIRKVLIGDKNLRVIKSNDLVRFLGEYEYSESVNKKFVASGIVNALAYTPLGGSVLKVEATKCIGSGKVKITGMIGQVMNESVDVALSYIKSNRELFKLNDIDFDKIDIHLHFLEAAVKKDGPSAGIAITTVLLSLFLDKKVDFNLSMTGEVNLHGEVMKIGGLREKLIGAYNNNVTKVFIPSDNSSDLKDVPEEVLKHIKIFKVNNYIEIYNKIFK